MTEKDKLILGFPREIKLGLLRDALKEEKFGIFLGLSRVLLEATISEGGIETEVIDAIFKEHSKDAK
jgi:hypothetical protein